MRYHDNDFDIDHNSLPNEFDPLYYFFCHLNTGGVNDVEIQHELYRILRVYVSHENLSEHEKEPATLEQKLRDADVDLELAYQFHACRNRLQQLSNTRYLDDDVQPTKSDRFSDDTDWSVQPPRPRKRMTPNPAKESKVFADEGFSDLEGQEARELLDMSAKHNIQDEHLLIYLKQERRTLSE